MAQDRCVAVGLLTSAGLSMLGQQFDRHFPVEHDDVFAELLAQLGKVEATRTDAGVAPHCAAE